MEFRFATINDVDSIFDLIQTVGKDSSDIYHFSSSKDYYRDLVENHPCVVCCDGDKIVGSFLSYTGNEDSDNIYKLAGICDSSSAVIFKNYQVSPEYRGQKIGKKMGCMLWMEFIKDYDYAVATVHPYNIASIKTLMALGFEIVTLADIHGGKPRYIMCKNLREMKGADCLILY